MHFLENIMLFGEAHVLLNMVKKEHPESQLGKWLALG